MDFVSSSLYGVTFLSSNPKARSTRYSPCFPINIFTSLLLFCRSLTVSTPYKWSFLAVFSPTVCSDFTFLSSTNVTKSSLLGISKYPSGFFSSLAVFAAVFEYAKPTEQVRESSSLTLFLISCPIFLASSHEFTFPVRSR